MVDQGFSCTESQNGGGLQAFLEIIMPNHSSRRVKQSTLRRAFSSLVFEYINVDSRFSDSYN